MRVEEIIEAKHAGDIEQLSFIFSDEKKDYCYSTSWMWKNNSNDKQNCKRIKQRSYFVKQKDFGNDIQCECRNENQRFIKRIIA